MGGSAQLSTHRAPAAREGAPLQAPELDLLEWWSQGRRGKESVPRGFYVTARVSHGGRSTAPRMWGSNSRSVFSHSSGDPKSEIKVPAGPLFPRGSQEGAPSGSGSFLQSRWGPCWCDCSLCLHPPVTFSPLYLHPQISVSILSRMPGIGLGAHLKPRMASSQDT